MSYRLPERGNATGSNRTDEIDGGVLGSGVSATKPGWLSRGLCIKEWVAKVVSWEDGGRRSFPLVLSYSVSSLPFLKSLILSSHCKTKNFLVERKMKTNCNRYPKKKKVERGLRVKTFVISLGNRDAQFCQLFTAPSYVRLIQEPIGWGLNCLPPTNQCLSRIR